MVIHAIINKHIPDIIYLFFILFSSLFKIKNSIVKPMKNEMAYNIMFNV